MTVWRDVAVDLLLEKRIDDVHKDVALAAVSVGVFNLVLEGVIDAVVGCRIDDRVGIGNGAVGIDNGSSEVRRVGYRNRRRIEIAVGVGIVGGNINGNAVSKLHIGFIIRHEWSGGNIGKKLAGGVTACDPEAHLGAQVLERQRAVGARDDEGT